MTSNRCLSDLPDDLLRHILSFAPAKEAATTAVVSRRWRSLWRTCGAINIDSRSCGRRRLTSAETRVGFLRVATAALAAPRVPIKRLTLYVELEPEDHAESSEASSLSRSDRAKRELRGMIDAILSNPAARRVEELRIGAQKFNRASAVAHAGWGFRELSFGGAGHPSEALRVLHVTNCSSFTLPPPGTSSFPKLSEMRLRGCGVSYKELQGMIDAAPQLATLQLESVCLSGDDDEETALNDSRAKVEQCYQLRCPAVTALVLEDCGFPWSARDGIELDMPRLIYLRFKGLVSRERQRLSLKSHVPLLDRVDLHFTDDVCLLSDEDNKVRVPFWQFLRNFSNAKVLKLKMDYPIDRIAVAEKKLDALLGDKLFSNLQCLEIEGTYQASSEASGFAIGNLLHCCPVVHDLRVKLSKMQPRQTTSCLLRFAKLKAQSDFKESVDHFKQRRISLDEDGDVENYDVISDIPGLSEHSFNCMHKHLRRVSLQFCSEEPNCFVAQLARFFALNAVVLEEMHIDDGNHRLCEHLSGKVGKWKTNSSQRRNSPVLAQRECGDRLSNLSDGVLGHILSFLPAFEAARATMLSRRWRHIFAAVHTLSLDSWERPIRYVDVDWPVPIVDLAPIGDLISAALIGRHRGGAGAPLRELRIAFRDFSGVTPAMMDQWLSCALQLAAGEFHLDLGLGGSLVCSLGRRSTDPGGNGDPYAGPHATCGGERDDSEEDEEYYPASRLTDDDAVPRAILVPRRLFSCVTLQSLCLGPCRLDLPASIDMPSLERLQLIRVVGPAAGAQVQRLVTACPRLADLTLEACAKLTTLSVLDKPLRRLALQCCHKLAAVAADASELRVFEYRGVVPAPPFLTMHGTPRIWSCTLDLCGEEPTDPSELREFLQLFASAEHLAFKSAPPGSGIGHDFLSSAPAFPTFVSLRSLEMMGLSQRDDATVVAAVTRMLEQSPSLETLSFFFLPEPLKKANNNHTYSCGKAILDLHQLRYDRHVALAVPDGTEIPCMAQRLREINLVHYQGVLSQRMLTKFLLCNAPAVEELCCVFAPGPLWMQTKLMEEMRNWVRNKSTKLTFI